MVRIIFILRSDSGTLRNPQPPIFPQKYCRYKWEGYCGTNTRLTAAFPFLYLVDVSDIFNFFLFRGAGEGGGVRGGGRRTGFLSKVEGGGGGFRGGGAGGGRAPGECPWGGGGG